MAVAYDQDIVAWADEQAMMIRAGRFDRLDLDHLADEIESLGKSEQRALMNRLAVLLAHLLKWQHQPSHRGRSWELTIAEQRAEIEALLEDSPSIAGRLDDPAALARVWKRSVLAARRDTGLDSFPEVCPWAMADVLREGWMPV